MHGVGQTGNLWTAKPGKFQEDGGNSNDEHDQVEKDVVKHDQDDQIVPGSVEAQQREQEH